LIILTVILVAGTTINILFRYVIIASLETKKILVISVIASGLKLILTIILVLQIQAELGVIIGFSIAPILSAILFAFIIRSLFRNRQNNPSFKFFGTLRIILRASIATWIPSLMDTVGAQIGNVMMLGIQGSNQAGIYFIAFQIVIGISAVIWALESVAYPILSAMSHGRRRALWQLMKIGLVIVLPFSLSLIFYSKDIMQIFGDNYIEGSVSLQLLLLSIFPTAISAGISILMFAYGNYRDVLIIGLASSIPRILLYAVLIPWYSGTGAALSFTLGTVIGLIVSIIIGKRSNIILVWKDLFLISSVPLAFAFALSIVNLHFIPSILISITLSYIVLLRYEIVTRDDVQNSLSILPSNFAIPIINTVNKIGSKLNKNY
jgi:O-antigen/teichoic acid export membrane protein